MSYATIASITESQSLRRRLTAAAAEEHKTEPYEGWVSQHIWTLAASPGWAAAWESAEAGGITDPGASEGVITDPMILSAVQPIPPVPPTMVGPGSDHDDIASTDLDIVANPTSPWAEDEYATFSDGTFRWDGDSWVVWTSPEPDPLVITALSPDSASIQGVDFEGHIQGTGFTEDTEIIWNGAPEPTTFVSSTDVWTLVRPSVVTAPTVLDVYVVDNGSASNIVQFTWEA